MGPVAAAARQQAVVVLRYYEDRSEAEVAALLHMSLSTVHSQAPKAWLSRVVDRWQCLFAGSLEVEAVALAGHGRLWREYSEVCFFCQILKCCASLL